MQRSSVGIVLAAFCAWSGSAPAANSGLSPPTEAALFLLQFEVVRNIGVSMLASAGIAGLVIGLAAQRPVSSLLGGIQLSITQPIRIGNTVLVEGESGTIEEIRLTYVMVKICFERSCCGS